MVGNATTPGPVNTNKTLGVSDQDNLLDTLGVMTLTSCASQSTFYRKLSIVRRFLKLQIRAVLT